MLSAIFVTLHIFGAIIGAGAAFMGDYLFFQSIGDDKIDTSELRLLDKLSRMVWIGLGLLIFTGIGFVLMPYIEPTYTFATSPRFWTKMCAVIVLTINGIILHTYVKPLLKASQNTSFSTSIRSKNKINLILTTGAISIASWTITIVFGAWKSIPLTGIEFLVVYIAFLAGAQIGAHTIIRHMLFPSEKRS